MNRYELMRYERGLSLRAAAAQAGIGRETLRRIEATGDVSAMIAPKLAAAYGLTVTELLGVTAQPDREAA